MACTIDDLPDELLEYILSLLPPYKDLQRCKLVSKRWWHATDNVIEHHKAHFHKSVALGSLLWNTGPAAHRLPTIGKRHSHSACTFENSMYVFGGCTASSTTFNDLWRLDLDTRTWVRPVTMGSYPSPKACASMLYYDKSLIVFGGWSQPSSYPLHQQWKLFNELHEYSIESNRWSAINTLDTPPPTSAHSATVHGNLMVVFGGVSSGYSSNDVWCLNLNRYTWHKQATSELKPLPRYGQSQIELDEKHLLVLGGCTRPNVVMNDAWLLEMEGEVWTWKKVNIHNTEWAPARIWGHQACKVGNHIIVLSKGNRRPKSSDISLPLRSFGCQHAPSSQADTVPVTVLHESHQGSYSTVEKEMNVNGRHGTLPKSNVQNVRSSFEIANMPKLLAMGDHFLSLAAFRGTNANPDYRQRQLEYLRRVEKRLRDKIIQQRGVKKAESTLAIFVLNIANVLRAECSASWIRLRNNDQSGPDDRILYSLVPGRGELIVFGGIRKEQTTVPDEFDVDSVVYNDLHFINPPRYII